MDKLQKYMNFGKKFYRKTSIAIEKVMKIEKLILDFWYLQCYTLANSKQKGFDEE